MTWEQLATLREQTINSYPVQLNKRINSFLAKLEHAVVTCKTTDELDYVKQQHDKYKALVTEPKLLEAIDNYIQEYIAWFAKIKATGVLN